MTLPPTNARMAPTAVITTAGALAAYDRAVMLGSPEAYQQAADMLADVVRRGSKRDTGLVSSVQVHTPESKPKRKAAGREPLQADVFNAQNLAAALERVTKAMEFRMTIPILTMVRITVSGGRCTITGTDLDMSATEVLTECDADDMDLCVPAKTLLDAIKGTRGGIAIADQTVRVEDVNTVTEFVVAAAGIDHKMTGLDAGDFPTVEKKADLAYFMIDAAALRAKLQFVATGISTEETRYFLNGAYMHLTQVEGVPNLTIVATDGHRLFRDNTPAPEITGHLDGVILPRKAVGWLTKNLPKAGDVRVSVWKNVASEKESSRARVTFEWGNSSMTTRIIDGSFPDYCRVIPRPDATKTLVHIADTGAVCDVLTRIGKVSAEKSKSTKFLISEDLGVMASVKNFEGGKATGDLPATAAKGAKLDIGFNLTYVTDALAKGKSVNLLMGEGNDPALVEYPDFPGRVSVLMPLRV